MIRRNKWAFQRPQTQFSSKFTLKHGKEKKKERKEREKKQALSIKYQMPQRREIRFKARMDSGLYLCREVIRASKRWKKVEGC